MSIKDTRHLIEFLSIVVSQENPCGDEVNAMSFLQGVMAVVKFYEVIECADITLEEFHTQLEIDRKNLIERFN